jgi:hypothetical protein
LLHLFLATASVTAAAAVLPTYAAAATCVISTHKPATASSSLGRHTPKKANDGNLTSRWLARSRSYPQRWTVDLGTRRPVESVVVYWQKADERAYGYHILASNDLNHWDVLRDGSDNAKVGATSDAVSGVYRYVRVKVVSSTCGRADIREVLVYGDDMPTPADWPQPGLTPVPAGRFNVRDYGAKANGTADDRAAITRAARAAVAGGGHVYFPAGTYRLGGPMQAVAGAYYYAPRRVTLKTHGDIYGANGCCLDGFNFRCYGGARAISIGDRDNLVTGMTVRNCSFAAGSSQYTHTRVMLALADDCTLDRNRFSGTPGSGGNIQVIGGKRNHITNNTIRGGTTSILFMWSQWNGGGEASVIEDNVVTGNVYSGASEEGISFDVMGNSRDNGLFEYDALTAVDGQTVTLSNRAFPDYTGYDVVFVDGELAGRTRTITAQNGNAFTLAASLAGAAPADHVTLAAVYKRNYVAYNTGTSASTALLLYGNCFGNTLEYNTVTGDNQIRVSSVNHLTPAGGSVTLKGTTSARAPSGFNTVRGNSADQRVQLVYYSSSGTEQAYVSVGNNVIANTTPVVNANLQRAYVWGNTGTESLSNVVKAASAYVYDGGQ